MNIERKKVKLTEIKPNPNNPRQVKNEAFKKLCKSIKDFPEMLEIREVVVDENMIILGGNQRYKALKEVGEKECIAKIVTGLSEEQKREFIIKDNSPDGISGEWDFTVLNSEFDKVELEEWGINFDIITDNNKEAGKENINNLEYTIILQLDEITAKKLDKITKKQKIDKEIFIINLINKYDK